LAYESGVDKENERRTVHRLRSLWPHLLINHVSACDKDDSRWGWDFEIWTCHANGQLKLRSLVEYKKRHFRFGQYPTVMLAKQKVDGLLTNVYAAIPMFLVEDSTGTLRWANLSMIDPDTIVMDGGRTRATRRKLDVEPCYYIPNSLFKPVEVVPWTK